MQCSYSASWLATLDDRCAVLEALAEAWVLAYQIEMADEDGSRKETFPCCVKCAELCFCPVPGMAGEGAAPLTPEQEKVLAKARGVGDIDLHGGPRSIRVKSAQELVRARRANAVELALYQCACERFRERNCHVAVDYDEGGNVHAYVRYPETGEMKNPQEMTVSSTACSCGGHGEG